MSYDNLIIVSIKSDKIISRSKYIDIKYLTIQDHVKEYEYVSTELIIVDSFTKNI